MTERVCGILLDGVYRNRKTGELYRVETVADKPTMTLRSIENGDLIGGVIGAPIFDDFVELLPADESQKHS